MAAQAGFKGQHAIVPTPFASRHQTRLNLRFLRGAQSATASTTADSGTDSQTLRPARSVRAAAAA